jgi:hypothetical protein
MSETIAGSIGGYVYKNIISDKIKRVKQGHFMDGIFWSINDDFGTKRRIDFSQTLAMTKKRPTRLS